MKTELARSLTAAAAELLAGGGVYPSLGDVAHIVGLLHTAAAVFTAELAADREETDARIAAAPPPPRPSKRPRAAVVVAAPAAGTCPSTGGRHRYNAARVCQRCAFADPRAPRAPANVAGPAKVDPANRTIPGVA